MISRRVLRKPLTLPSRVTCCFASHFHDLGPDIPQVAVLKSITSKVLARVAEDHDDMTTQPNTPYA